MINIPGQCFFVKADFLSWQKSLRILAVNIREQFFFVIITTASTRCFVQNFQLICYSQRVNARHNTTTVEVQHVQNGPATGWLQR